MSLDSIDASRARLPLLAALIVAAGAVAYANSFTGLFAGLDAKESIRDNPHIRQLWPLSEAMSLPLLDATLAADEGSKGGTVVRRPILSLTFALNYVLFGPNPNGFHAVNLAIHLAAALVVLGLVRRTLLHQGFGAAHADALAAAIALLWVVHPVDTEAVTYLVQRAESLMGLMLLLTLYCAVRALDARHPAPWYAGAATACAIGMGTKETMAVTPVLVLLYDHVFVAGTWRNKLRRRWPLYGALAACWLVLVVLILTTFNDAMRDFDEGRTLPYLLSQPRVILHYLRLAFWPHPLHLYVNTYRFEVQLGITPLWQILWPFVPVLVLLGVTAVGVWRKRWYGFLGGAFFLILAPTSSIVATSDILQEHRIYLPLAAVIALTVVTVDLVLRPRENRSRRLIGIGALGVAVIAFMALTHQRNRDYHSEFAMIYPEDLQEAYTILADHHLNRGTLAAEVQTLEGLVSAGGASPEETAYAHFLRGFLQESRGELDAAVASFQRVTAIQPDLPQAYMQMAAALMQQGDLKRAAVFLNVAVQQNPYFAEAHGELAFAYAQLGEVNRAKEHFERALLLKPIYPDALAELSTLLEEEGQRDAAAALLQQAIDAMQRVVAVNPNAARANRQLGVLLARRGDRELAEEHLRRVLAVAPDSIQAYYAHIELGVLAKDRGNTAAAAAHFRQAVDIHPQSPEAHYELAMILMEQGKNDEAAEHFERALALRPLFPNTHYEYGMLLAAMGERKRAIERFERALELQPDFDEARGALERARGGPGEP